MLIKNLLALKKTALGFAIGWTVLIAVLCLVSFNDLPSVDVNNIDKIVHATFYFVLILLWGFYSVLKQDEIKIPTIGYFVVLSIVYGIIIEILQGTLTKTRHGDVIDVIANSTGAILGLLVFVLVKKRKTIR